MLITLLGIAILVRFEQSMKDEFPKLVTLSEMVTLVSPLQP